MVYIPRDELELIWACARLDGLTTRLVCRDWYELHRPRRVRLTNASAYYLCQRGITIPNFTQALHRYFCRLVDEWATREFPYSKKTVSMKRGIEQFCRHRDEYPRVSLSRQLSPVTFRAYDSGFYHYISRFNDLLFACYAPLGRAPFTLTNGFYDCWRRWSVDCTVPRLEETKEIDGQLCVRIVPLFPAVPIAPSTLAPVYIVSSTSEPLYLETALLNNRERREFCRGPTVARTLQDEYILFALGCSGLSPELDSRLDYYSFYF